MAVTHKKQSIFFSNWTKSNLIKIEDIWDNTANSWKTGNFIIRHLNNKRNWIAEYEKIKTCIPHKWKELLKRKFVEVDTPQTISSKKNIVLTSKSITVCGKDIPYKKLKLKDLYNQCLYPVSIPTCVITWSRIFQIEPSLDNMFSYNHFIHHKKSQELHWKILHRAIYSEEKLRLMNKSNGICKLCNIENETLCHLFHQCSKISNIWPKIHKVITNVTGKTFPMDSIHIMLGYNKTIIGDEITRIMYNYFVFITKWLIWKHRNNVKFGTTNLQTSEFIYNETIKLCKDEAENIRKSYKWKKCNTELKSMLSDTIEWKQN